MLAVTLTPWVATGFPFASCTCTAGCCANGTPLRAVAEGGVVRASCPGAAAVMLNDPLVATGIVPLVAVKVYVPTLLTLSPGKVATPATAACVGTRPSV